MANKKKNLTPKQQRFVDFYDGNGEKAARKAGYKGSAAQLRVMASQNLTKPNIQEAIRKREQKRNGEDIATREKRQAFWTRVFQGEEVQDVVIGKGEDRKIVKVPPKMADRLKASELLGRSEADFIDRHELSGKDGKALFTDIKIELVSVSDTFPKDAKLERP
ncbi:MAG: terminase small subunit [Thermodesulfobacteriota bacterium]|nr:MAG: terminase small subunit [Thermodesulfobacteriota bacterium]